MALAKVDNAQRDFSAGEVDPTLKRNEDNPVMKAGVRQCANFRILNSKAVKNRFGRSAQFLDGPRVDEVLMAPGSVFRLCFSAATITVRNSTGASVFTQGGFPWAANTVQNIIWDRYQSQVFITFPGMQPLVLTWAGGSSFSIASFAEQVYSSGQKRTFFYRLSPLGVTMLPSGTTGSITLTFSAGMNLVAGHIGTRMRFVGRQLLITAVASSISATATVIETLPQAQRLTFAVSSATVFSVGDIVLGSQTGAKGQVAALGVGGISNMDVVILNGIYFTNATSPNNEYCVGPAGSLGVSAQTQIPPVATNVWDDELMNSFRGWPASCFVDQNRLVFCNFPALPAAIGWSAIGLTTDLYVPNNIITADNAILELAPGKNQVLYGVPGAESSEFIFCDNAIFWIPITATDPLAPGSVAFNLIDEGCAAVQPRFLQGAIVYVNAGATMVKSIVATGALTRPYEAQSLTEYHAHLVKSPVAIAAPQAEGTFPERYFYVLNGDGTVIACRYKIKQGQIAEQPGWFTITGAGTVNWISARAGNVWFVTTYSGASGPMAELVDDTQYLDAAFAVNSPPSQLIPPGGKGPLWWMPGQPVTLMDLGTRQMDTYQTDANGFIIPQNIGGENLLSAQLVAGQPWTATLEPFTPSPGPGQDMRQRMVRRKVSRVAVYVINSTGFLFARLFSGPLLPATAPDYAALGTVMNTRRVTTYNQDDDATQPPPQREGTELWRPSGRSFDPRIAIIKDTAGPLTVAEVGMEVTV